MSFSRGPRLATPYLPIVKAIAPPAPIGARRMTRPTILKKTPDSDSKNRITGPASLTHPGQRESEEHRQQDHLKQIAASGEGVRKTLRDDVQQKLCDALGLALFDVIDGGL